MMKAIKCEVPILFIISHLDDTKILKYDTAEQIVVYGKTVQ